MMPLLMMIAIYIEVGSTRASPAIAFMLDCFALDSIIYVICFDIYHSTIHVFAFVKARASRYGPGQAGRSVCAVVIVLHITAAHPILKHLILFGCWLFMAALLNINFIAFAVAHLGLLRFSQRETMTTIPRPRARPTD